MQPYANLIAIDKTAQTPVFLQIASALAEGIRSGRIPVGAQLPGSRALAQVLGVHRQTVVSAYEELTAQGWLTPQSARGTFVNEALPEVRAQRSATGRRAGQAGFAFADDPMLGRPVLTGKAGPAFDDGFPDVRLAPWDAFGRALRTVLRQGHRKGWLQYGDTAGEETLREALAEHLRETRGIALKPEEVLITRGSVMGIYLTAQLALRPGDGVVVGAQGYGSANLAFRQAGATLLETPVDEYGLDVEAVADWCARRPVQLVYVTPHHHYPTTATMPAARRMRLLQLAQQYGFCVLEDDYDYDFHYEGAPVSPLAAADTSGQVVYVGSLCKAIAPALRIGYVAAAPDLIAAMGRRRRIVDRQGDNLAEAAVALLFREGEIRRHLKKAHRTYQQRRDFCCGQLRASLGDAIDFAVPTGGMAIWARFDPALPLSELSARAAARGLYLSDGSAYAQSGLNATRMGFASMTEEEMAQAAALLRACL